MSPDTREHRITQRLIERELSGRALTTEERSQMRGHVRDCETCRRFYDRYVEAEAALYETESGSVTPGQLARVEDRLLGHFDRNPRPGRAFWLPAALFSSVAVLVFVVVIDRSEDGFQSRGGEANDGPMAVFRALRVETGATGEPRLSELEPRDSVGPLDRFVFLGACPEAACTVSVFALTADGVDHALLRPHALDAGGHDVRLGEVLTIPSQWPPGQVHFQGKFEYGEGRMEVRTLTVHLSRGDP